MTSKRTINYNTTTSILNKVENGNSTIRSVAAHDLNFTFKKFRNSLLFATPSSAVRKIRHPSGIVVRQCVYNSNSRLIRLIIQTISKNMTGFTLRPLYFAHCTHCTRIHRLQNWRVFGRALIFF